MHCLYLYVCVCLRVQPLFLISSALCSFLVEPSKQKKRSDGNLPMTRFNLVGICIAFISLLFFFFPVLFL